MECLYSIWVSIQANSAVYALLPVPDPLSFAQGKGTKEERIEHVDDIKQLVKVVRLDAVSRSLHRLGCKLCLGAFSLRRGYGVDSRRWLALSLISALAAAAPDPVLDPVKRQTRSQC